MFSQISSIFSMKCKIRNENKLTSCLSFYWYTFSLVLEFFDFLPNNDKHFFSKSILSDQARIHTGFHRFTEIGQIFHNKYIFSKKL